MMTGFMVPASRQRAHQPAGSAPMYVRRWPRISPRRARRRATCGRTSARRPGDRLADRRLAGAGRPDERQDDARAPVVRHAALGAELPHRQVLDDALLHVVEAGVVGVEDLAGVDGIQALLGALRPRDREQPVEVGPDGRGLGALLAHALQAAELALGLRADVLGHARRLDLRAVLAREGLPVLPELLLDGLELAAEEILLLLLLGAGLDVVADALADLELGEALLLQAERERQALDDVERLEQLDLLREREVGRVARGVRQRAGLDDRAEEGRDAAVVAAVLEDLHDHGAVLALEVHRAAARRGDVRLLLDVDHELAGRAAGGAGHATMEAVQHDGAPAAGQAHLLRHLGDDADRRVLRLVARDEEHALRVPDLERQGDGHGGEDDGVFECDQS
jgi:hypothetical protein